jgi:hypothetical protein
MGGNIPIERNFSLSLTVIPDLAFAFFAGSQ